MERASRMVIPRESANKYTTTRSDRYLFLLFPFMCATLCQLTCSLKLKSGRVTMLPAQSSGTGQSMRFVSVCPRNPLTFSGDPSQNFDDWTAEFERVSSHIGWDNTINLANVI